jgi:hypothetical protein
LFESPDHWTDEAKLIRIYPKEVALVSIEIERRTKSQVIVVGKLLANAKGFTINSLFQKQVVFV